MTRPRACLTTRSPQQHSSGKHWIAPATTMTPSCARQYLDANLTPRYTSGGEFLTTEHLRSSAAVPARSIPEPVAVSFLRTPADNDPLRIQRSNPTRRRPMMLSSRVVELGQESRHFYLWPCEAPPPSGIPIAEV